MWVRTAISEGRPVAALAAAMAASMALDVVAVGHALHMPAVGGETGATSSVKARSVEPSIVMWLSS